MSKSVKCFQRNTNVLGLSPFFSVRKNCCTVLRQTPVLSKTPFAESLNCQSSQYLRYLVVESSIVNIVLGLERLDRDELK